MAPTTNTIWPSPPIELHPNLKHLITRFFEISDITDPESGTLFTEEIFTNDGVLKMGSWLVYSGKEEIAASRKTMSPVIQSRQHEVVQVFASNSPATDVLVLGSLTIQLNDGSEVKTEFNARMVLDESGKRVKLVVVWSDPTLMIEAFKRAAANLQGGQAK
ncbi:hypothetical protein HDV00_012275 [Rhizophlyctis rosea]|nr:hypothetical protein HDV00_012275 [Rhizophlyctis rosea]